MPEIFHEDVLLHLHELQREVTEAIYGVRQLERIRDDLTAVAKARIINSIKIAGRAKAALTDINLYAGNRRPEV